MKTAFKPEEVHFLAEAVQEVANSARGTMNRWTMDHIARLVFEAYRDGVRDRGMLIKIGEIAIDPAS